MRIRPLTPGEREAGEADDRMTLSLLKPLREDEHALRVGLAQRAAAHVVDVPGHVCAGRIEACCGALCLPLPELWPGLGVVEDAKTK